MSDWYRLDEHRNPVRTDLFSGARALDDIATRRVAYTELSEHCHVSTVFLGLDHQFGQGPPLVFETMVFGGPCDGDQDRYSTWAEAEAGHQRIVERVRERLGLDRAG